MDGPRCASAELVDDPLGNADRTLELMYAGCGFVPRKWHSALAAAAGFLAASARLITSAALARRARRRRLPSGSSRRRAHVRFPTRRLLAPGVPFARFYRRSPAKLVRSRARPNRPAVLAPPQDAPARDLFLREVQEGVGARPTFRRPYLTHDEDPALHQGRMERAEVPHQAAMVEANGLSLAVCERPRLDQARPNRALRVRVGNGVLDLADVDEAHTLADMDGHTPRLEEVFTHPDRDGCAGGGAASRGCGAAPS